MPQAHGRLTDIVSRHEYHPALLEHVLQPGEVRRVHAAPPELKAGDGVGREPRRRAEVAQAEAQRGARQPGLQRRDRRWAQDVPRLTNLRKWR